MKKTFEKLFDVFATFLFNLFGDGLGPEGIIPKTIERIKRLNDGFWFPYFCTQAILCFGYWAVAHPSLSTWMQYFAGVAVGNVCMFFWRRWWCEKTAPKDPALSKILLHELWIGTHVARAAKIFTEDFKLPLWPKQIRQSGYSLEVSPLLNTDKTMSVRLKVGKTGSLKVHVYVLVWDKPKSEANQNES